MVDSSRIAGLLPSEIWLLAGSQSLYGDETLRAVREHSEHIAIALDASPAISAKVVFKGVLKSPEEIAALCDEANGDAKCVGLIVWMHTFSPAKMWIGGLKILRKPLLHLHTQFNRDIPWRDIDMDFMNLNQSAHGDREFGFIATRLRIRRKVVVGHWQDKKVHDRIGVWARVATAWHDWQGARFCRFGDNMRQVAVTEGDKLEAQIRLGYSVDGYGIGDLVEAVQRVPEEAVNDLVREYEDRYSVDDSLRKKGARHGSLREAAKIEAGLRAFLEDGGFRGFTDSFEVLHGLGQLPGIAVQRLMAEGYGFGAEGDWKTAALVRALKVMAAGMNGGNSFMEDYTYHLDPSNPLVLGAHMLEICESIAEGQPSCKIHPLSIGGKGDPVRLVFSVAEGPALNASMIDLGSRFRLLVNTVEAVRPPEDLPKLPVARVLWKPDPDLYTGCAAWILAGGAHHTCYSQNLTPEYLEDFAEMAGVEYVLIDRDTRLQAFKDQLRANDSIYH